MSSHLVRVYSSTSRLAPLGRVFGGRLPVSHKVTQHTLPHPTVEIVKKKDGSTYKAQDMQRHFPRQLSQEISSQKRLNLAREGERFMQC